MVRLSRTPNATLSQLSGRAAMVLWQVVRHAAHAKCLQVAARSAAGPTASFRSHEPVFLVFPQQRRGRGRQPLRQRRMLGERKLAVVGPRGVHCSVHLVPAWRSGRLGQQRWWVGSVAARMRRWNWRQRGRLSRGDTLSAREDGRVRAAAKLAGEGLHADDGEYNMEDQDDGRYVDHLPRGIRHSYGTEPRGGSGPAV